MLLREDNTGSSRKTNAAWASDPRVFTMNCTRSSDDQDQLIDIHMSYITSETNKTHQIQGLAIQLPLGITEDCILDNGNTGQEQEGENE